MIGQNWSNWQCYLAGSFKIAPRIFIFSIVLGAKYLFDVKSIETHACTFLTLNMLAKGRVQFLIKNRGFYVAIV